MKVIFIKNVDGQGRAGDIRNVTDAYARNFLFPKKLAESATGQSLHIADDRKRRQAQFAMRQQAIMIAARARVDGQLLELQAAANPHGTLFAAIKTPALQQALHQQFHVPDMALTFDPDHIKTTGSHRVVLEWPDGVKTVLSVTIAPTTASRSGR